MKTNHENELIAAEIVAHCAELGLKEDTAQWVLAETKTYGQLLRLHPVIFTRLNERGLVPRQYQGINLEGFTAPRVTLRGLDFSRANLRCAWLAWANLSETNLSHADLQEANLRGARLTNADLTGANLVGADLDCADLTGANLTGANLRGANFRGARLHNVQLEGAQLAQISSKYSIL